MKFTSLREDHPVIYDILHNHRLMIFCTVLVVWYIILNSFYICSITLIISGHWNILHIVHEDSLLSCICHGFLHGICPGLFKCNDLSDILILIGQDFIRIK